MISFASRRPALRVRATLPLSATLAFALLLACPGTDAPEQSSPPTTGGGEEPMVEPLTSSHADADPRALAADATFGDLVAAITASEVAERETATAPCVLSGGTSGASAHLDAELAAAVHPIPDAPADLGSRLSPAPVAILSRYGAEGPAQPTLAVATLTATDPPDAGEQLLIILTTRGVILRSTTRRMEPGTPVPIDDLRAAFDELPHVPELIALTGESAVPLSTLRRALAEIPDALVPRLALAVTLPPGTRTPSAGDTPERHPVCEDLAPTEADSPEGTLSVENLLAGVATLRAAMPECVRDAGSSARSGGMVLRFRVGADGSLAAACIATDDTASDGLRGCVLDRAQRMRFRTPSPAGVVEAAIPLRFEIDHGAAAHGLCLSP